MNSIATAKKESPLAAEQATLTHWQGLSVEEKAFVAAYIDGGYSVAAAADSLGTTPYVANKHLNKVSVRRAITEVQEQLDSIDFLNEKWVKTQLLKLFPKVMGEEPVAIVDNTGCEVQARKFYPDIAMRVIEYVAPKKAASVNIDIHGQVDLRVAIAEGNARRATLLEESIEGTCESTHERSEENAAE